MKKSSFLLLLACAPFLTPARAQILPTAEIPAGTVVATVDGKKLTAGEIRAAIANMPVEFTQLYRQNPQVAIQQMYVMNHLAAEAEKAKLGDESPLKEQLALLRANVLASTMLSWEHNHFQVPNEAIQEYYNKNKAKYQQSKIKVIFIGFKPPAVGTAASIEDVAKAAAEAAVGKVQRSEVEAKTLAEDIVKQIRGGADFAKLVAQYSEDLTSKAAGGDFGVVNAGSVYPDEIKNAVMASQPGDVTNPIRQPSGFYVIRVEDRTGQSVADAKDSISAELRQVHVNEWFTQIRDRYAVKVENPQFFTQPAPGQPAGSQPSPVPAPAAPLK
jgi:peptidyl-prolyl cis-trans isomerase C